MRNIRLMKSWERIHPVTRIVIITIFLFVLGLVLGWPVIYKSTGFLIGIYCGIVFVWLVSKIKK